MIYYETHGDSGQPLVFVPGLTCASSDWNKQVQELKQDFRCICVDLRGHGRSADQPGPYDMATLAAGVVEVLRHLQVTKSIVIGHSMGVRVITETLLQAPDAVAGLVFVDGSQQGQGDPTASREKVMDMIDNYSSPKDFVADMFASMFVEDSDAAERQAIIERAVAMPSERLKELLGNLITWDAEQMSDAFSKINVPVAVLQSTTIDTERNRRPLQRGETSPFLEFIRQTIPSAQIEVVPDVGHFTQLDAPEPVNAAIRRIAGQLG